MQLVSLNTPTSLSATYPVLWDGVSLSSNAITSLAISAASGYVFSGLQPVKSVPVLFTDMSRDIPLSYKGVWDATTNTPTLVKGVGTAGDYYAISGANTYGIASPMPQLTMYSSELLNQGVSANTNYISFNGVDWFLTRNNVDFSTNGHNGFNALSLGVPQTFPEDHYFPTSGLDLSSDFTYEGYFKGSSFTNGDAISYLRLYDLPSIIYPSWMNEYTKLGVTTGIGASNRFTITLRGSVFYSYISWAGVTPSVNVWHHFVLLRKGDVFVALLDGVYLPQQFTGTDSLVVLDDLNTHKSLLATCTPAIGFLSSGDSNLSDLSVDSCQISSVARYL